MPVFASRRSSLVAVGLVGGYHGLPFLHSQSQPGLLISNSGGVTVSTGVESAHFEAVSTARAIGIGRARLGKGAKNKRSNKNETKLKNKQQKNAIFESDNSEDAVMYSPSESVASGSRSMASESETKENVVHEDELMENVGRGDILMENPNSAHDDNFKSKALMEDGNTVDDSKLNALFHDDESKTLSRTLEDSSVLSSQDTQKAKQPKQTQKELKLPQEQLNGSAKPTASQLNGSAKPTASGKTLRRRRERRKALILWKASLWQESIGNEFMKGVNKGIDLVNELKDFKKLEEEERSNGKFQKHKFQKKGMNEKKGMNVAAQLMTVPAQLAVVNANEGNFSAAQQYLKKAIEGEGGFLKDGSLISAIINKTMKDHPEAREKLKENLQKVESSSQKDRTDAVFAAASKDFPNAKTALRRTRKGIQHAQEGVSSTKGESPLPQDGFLRQIKNAEVRVEKKLKQLEAVEQQLLHQERKIWKDILEPRQRDLLAPLARENVVADYWNAASFKENPKRKMDQKTQRAKELREKAQFHKAEMLKMGLYPGGEQENQLGEEGQMFETELQRRLHDEVYTNGEKQLFEDEIQFLRQELELLRPTENWATYLSFNFRAEFEDIQEEAKKPGGAVYKLLHVLNKLLKKPEEGGKLFLETPLGGLSEEGNTRGFGGFQRPGDLQLAYLFDIQAMDQFIKNTGIQAGGKKHSRYVFSEDSSEDSEEEGETTKMAARLENILRILRGSTDYELAVLTKLEEVIGQAVEHCNKRWKDMTEEEEQKDDENQQMIMDDKHQENDDDEEMYEGGQQEESEMQESQFQNLQENRKHTAFLSTVINLFAPHSKNTFYSSKPSVMPSSAALPSRLMFFRSSWGDDTFIPSDGNALNPSNVRPLQEKDEQQQDEQQESSSDDDEENYEGGQEEEMQEPSDQFQNAEKQNAFLQNVMNLFSPGLSNTFESSSKMNVIPSSAALPSSNAFLSAWGANAFVPSDSIVSKNNHSKARPRPSQLDFKESSLSFPDYGVDRSTRIVKFGSLEDIQMKAGEDIQTKKSEVQDTKTEMLGEDTQMLGSDDIIINQEQKIGDIYTGGFQKENYDGQNDGQNNGQISDKISGKNLGK